MKEKLLFSVRRHGDLNLRLQKLLNIFAQPARQLSHSMVRTCCAQNDNSKGKVNKQNQTTCLMYGIKIIQTRLPATKIVSRDLWLGDFLGRWGKVNIYKKILKIDV